MPARVRHREDRRRSSSDLVLQPVCRRQRTCNCSNRQHSQRVAKQRILQHSPAFSPPVPAGMYGQPQYPLTIQHLTNNAICLVHTATDHQVLRTCRWHHTPSDICVPRHMPAAIPQTLDIVLEALNLLFTIIKGRFED